MTAPNTSDIDALVNLLTGENPIGECGYCLNAIEAAAALAALKGERG